MCFWVFQVNGFGGLWLHSVESMSQGKLQTLVLRDWRKLGPFLGCAVWCGLGDERTETKCERERKKKKRH